MWGIIPAAGRGSRIQPLAFSKELLPVGSRIDGHVERPCAVSEYLVERMVIAGVDKLAFVISPGKSDILEYYGGGHRGASAIYIVQPSADGLCDAVFRPAPFVRDDEPVLVGLPDTVWFPREGLCDLPESRLSFLLFPVEHPELFDAVVLDEKDRIQEIQVKRRDAASRWIWGAFKMPGRIFHELHHLWLRRGRGDEFIGSLVNAYLANGGEAYGIRSGTAYVDVGTFGGYRSAIALLSASSHADTLSGNAADRSEDGKQRQPTALLSPRMASEEPAVYSAIRMGNKPSEKNLPPDRSAKLLLERIADLSQTTIDACRMAVVIAHPDDETIGCGGLLSRLENVCVVVITDGAPRNGVDARRCGFESPLAYKKVRAEELRAALAVAGIGGKQIINLDIADQEVCRSLPFVCRSLAAFFAEREITAVLTHAFEGGHPDHDGTAFSVHVAARQLRRQAPALIEMPFYHLGAEGWVTQTFCDGENGITITLPPRQAEAKAKMMNAYRSQAHVLCAFSQSVECYRIARAYDFRKLPNGGRVLYSLHDWALKPHDWGPLAQAALREIGLGEAQ